MANQEIFWLTRSGSHALGSGGVWKCTLDNGQIRVDIVNSTHPTMDGKTWYLSPHQSKHEFLWVCKKDWEEITEEEAIRITLGA